MEEIMTSKSFPRLRITSFLAPCNFLVVFLVLKSYHWIFHEVERFRVHVRVSTNGKEGRHFDSAGALSFFLLSSASPPLSILRPVSSLISKPWETRVVSPSFTFDRARETKATFVNLYIIFDFIYFRITPKRKVPALQFSIKISTLPQVKSHVTL